MQRKSTGLTARFIITLAVPAYVFALACMWASFAPVLQ